MKFKIIHNELLPVYKEAISKDIHTFYDALINAELSTDSYSFYTSVASV